MNMYLIIDDDEDIGEVLKYYLRKQGQAFYAPSLEVAKRMLQKLSPQAIFLDMSLPGEDPFPFIEMVQKDYPDIEVIVMSGFVDVFELRLEQMGITNILAKPFQQKEVIAQVSQKSSDRADQKKRRASRVDVSSNQEIYVDLLLEDSMERMKVKKISLGGLSIHCPKNFKIFDKDQTLEFFLKLPEQDLFKEKGIVRSVLLDSEEIGVEFIEPSGAFVSELIHFIENNPKVA